MNRTTEPSCRLEMIPNRNHSNVLPATAILNERTVMLMTIFWVADLPVPTGPSGVNDVDGSRSVSRVNKDPCWHRFLVGVWSLLAS